MHVATIQNTNGQAITLAMKHKDKRDPKDWKGFKFAVPFEYSMHNFLLRYYLAEHGLNPDTDVQIRVVPPPEMVANLRAGNIDGFLGPDPFNQRAVFEEVGFIHLLTKELWNGHPCCAFGTSTAFIQQNPNTFAALYRAVLTAAAMARDAKNRELIAKVIAHGATREEARVRLVRALAETVVLGPTTNRHFLIRLLEHPDFAAGEATTAFLTKHQFPAPEIGDAHWTAAAHLLWQASAAQYPPSLRGWRNSNPEPTPIRLAAGGTERLLQVREADTLDVPFHIDGNDILVDLDALTIRFTDKTYDLYEDDVPAAISQQIGERVTLVNEMIVFGELKAGTNVFYGGTGTSRATVNGGITLPLIRKMAKSLMANHGKMVTSVLKASALYGTDPNFNLTV